MRILRRGEPHGLSKKASPAAFFVATLEAFFERVFAALEPGTKLLRQIGTTKHLCWVLSRRACVAKPGG